MAGMQWADQVKSQAAFKWSADLHFVDAEGQNESIGGYFAC